MKLGTLLLRNAAISLTQLEAALRAQVIYGGRLGTNLVELGFVDLDQLATHLGELTQLPVATRALLDNADGNALALIDAATCERLAVMPLAIAAPPEPTLALAMVDPWDHVAIDELAGKTGLPITPHIVPELRLLYYLEKAYGLPRKARFVRSGTRRTPGPNDERRRAQPAGGIVMPPSVTLEPKARRRAAPASSPPAVPVAVHSEEPTPLPRLGWAFACDRLDHATQRDQIADVFLDFATGRFEAVVVFLVRDGNALGWYGRVAGKQPLTPVDQISLPLGPASSFQIAHDGMKPFHGPPPSPHPTENRLWEAIGTPPPLDVVVAPVLVRQRVVNLVYVHAAGGATIPDTDGHELSELAIRASEAYVRLIKRSKT